MDKKNFQNYAAVAIAAAIISGAVTWGGFSLYNKDKLRAGEQFSLLAECREIADRENIHDIDEEAAINGYLTAGYDKYTYVQFGEADTEENNVEYIKSYVNGSGTAYASGFAIDKADDGNILLVYVDEGKAAYKSGLREGDVITAIGGVGVAETGFENIANKLLGKQNTQVELTVCRGIETLEIPFVRDHVYLRDVDWDRIGDIGYIHIKHFTVLAQGNLSNALEELSDCKGYIFDLRNCPGGTTQHCINMLDYFCSDVRVYAYDKNNVKTEYEFPEMFEPIDTPSVLLVNGNTASSAEIFAASMKQFSLGGATILGEKTKGKGVSQAYYDLSNGAVLKCTFSTYTVGDWESYHEKGISPDIELAMDYSLIGTDNDIQLKKALELLD